MDVFCVGVVYRGVVIGVCWGSPLCTTYSNGSVWVLNRECRKRLRGVKTRVL